jgi:methionine-rich copper-binding protein CopC
MKRILIAAALALAGFGGPALAQSGHGDSNLLSATAPADDATVAAPRSIALTFAHPVTLQTVALTGPGGAVPLTFNAPNAPTAAYTIALPQLAAGHYEVRWTASHGGAAAQGLFHFTVR